MTVIGFIQLEFDLGLSLLTVHVNGCDSKRFHCTDFDSDENQIMASNWRKNGYFYGSGFVRGDIFIGEPTNYDKESNAGAFINRMKIL